MDGNSGVLGCAFTTPWPALSIYTVDISSDTYLVNSVIFS